ncbi:GNAT family N-acetyltransferase [Sulfurimonas sp. HSL-3221]|uniref:GNAT family N-acetyltransferase n=1 Tax=Sulfurimonadaceae TaxID=2771471 RepID=UPI001E3CFF94|nr:GNAT family N-acetyltransferase [Sulfurimonas sp. HSL-3221]UFS61377.1 GNAT family N-acetyltransferase [Sulfurimonas sp. HSL-3221]
MRWQWSLFETLSPWEILEIMKLRQAVFVVEQACAYQDADDLDPFSWHLTGWEEDSKGKRLVAYLRVVFPGRKFEEPSIGRVITPLALRGRGLGSALIHEAIERIPSLFQKESIRISAQQRLEPFYAAFGFETVSTPYDEDGIPHVEMLRMPQNDN